MIGIKVSDAPGNEAGSEDEATYQSGNKQVESVYLICQE